MSTQLKVRSLVLSEIDLLTLLTNDFANSVHFRYESLFTVYQSTCGSKFLYRELIDLDCLTIKLGEGYLFLPIANCRDIEPKLRKLVRSVNKSQETLRKFGIEQTVNSRQLWDGVYSEIKEILGL